MEHSTGNSESLSKTARGQSSLPKDFQNDFIEVVEVSTGRHLKEFLSLPHSIYKDPTSPYVMPLEMHMKMMMGKIKASQKHFYIAKIGGKTVARLGTKVHTAEGHTRLHFGFYECDPQYPKATKALIDLAHSKYPNLEMTGPYQFRQEDLYVGVLV